jgi:hypothetical protein
MLAVRIPTDLLDALTVEADALGVTRSEVVRARLEQDPVGSRERVATDAARQLRSVLELLDQDVTPRARHYLSGASAALDAVDALDQARWG